MVKKREAELESFMDSSIVESLLKSFCYFARIEYVLPYAIYILLCIIYILLYTT